MQPAYFFHFFLALLLTVFSECLASALLSLSFRDKKMLSRLVFAAGAGSVFTLPFVWFVFPFFFREYVPFILFAECFAFGAEFFFFKMFLKSSRRALLYTVVCNSVSFLLGVLFL